jgi:hypothetical protein
MRDYAGRKNQAGFLGCRINRSQQAASSKARAARFGIDSDLPHAREINYHSAVAGTESGKAVAAAPDSRQKPGTRSRANRALNVTNIGATRDQTRLAIIEHAVPDASRCFISGIARKQKLALESFAERRVCFFAGFRHLRVLLR